MRSQRYALHVLADKDRKTLRDWEEYCKVLRCKGVDTEDEEVFSHGFGDCYMTDIIYEQAISVIRATCSAGMEVVEIATDNGVDEPMDWVYRASDKDKRVATGSILEVLEDYNDMILNGTIDGYPHDEEIEDEDEPEDEEEDLEGE